MDSYWAKQGFGVNPETKSTQEGPELPRAELAPKNEKDRQARYRSFTSMPQWTAWKKEQREKERDKGARDIVSGNLVDAAWTGANASKEVAVETSPSVKPSKEVAMDESRSESDSNEGFEFTQADMEEFQVATLVSPSTDWRDKAATVQGNRSLIALVRKYGYAEQAALLEQYLTVDLSQAFQ